MQLIEVEWIDAQRLVKTKVVFWSAVYMSLIHIHIRLVYSIHRHSGIAFNTPILINRWHWCKNRSSSFRKWIVSYLLNNIDRNEMRFFPIQIDVKHVANKKNRNHIWRRPWKSHSILFYSMMNLTEYLRYFTVFLSNLAHSHSLHSQQRMYSPIDFSESKKIKRIIKMKEKRWNKN